MISIRYERELARVPLREDLRRVSANGNAGAAMQQIVGFGDELHVAVLDAVVDHLHVVAGAARAHVGDARLAVVGLGGDGAEDRRERVPRRRAIRPA